MMPTLINNILERLGDGWFIKGTTPSLLSKVKSILWPTEAFFFLKTCTFIESICYNIYWASNTPPLTPNPHDLRSELSALMEKIVIKIIKNKSFFRSIVFRCSKKMMYFFILKMCFKSATKYLQIFEIKVTIVKKFVAGIATICCTSVILWS